jgi:oligopeptide transport system substrate-binding protein
MYRSRLNQVFALLLCMIIASSAWQFGGGFAFAFAESTSKEPVALLLGSSYVQAGGKRLELETHPYLRNGTTLVPVRFVSEQLGAEVSWEGKTRTVMIRKAATSISVAIDSAVMTVNGRQVTLDTAAELYEGTTFIPLRAVGEALGQEVFYDEGLILIGDASTIGAYKADTGNKQKIRKALQGQSINIAMSAEPPLLNSALATANASFTILNAIHEGLYRKNPEGKLEPALAKELPTVSSDGLVYTIPLREGLQWSDGTALTARDFVYTYRHILDPATRSQYSFLLEWLEGGVTLHESMSPAEVKERQSKLGVRAIDDTTLEIRLEQPKAFFTELLSFPVFFPMQQAAVEGYGDQYGSEPENLVSAGPFILKSWEHNNKLVLAKNKGYWDVDNIQLDEVNVMIVRDTQSAVELAQTGKLDLALIGPANTSLYGSQIRIKKELTNAYVMFQADHFPAFSNVKIRQALGMAINRKELLDLIMKNRSVPSTGFVPYGTADGSGGEFRTTAGDTQPEYNPELARILLKEGVHELGLEELPEFSLIADDTTTGINTLTYISDQWKQHLGIKVKVTPVPHELRIDKQHNRDFDACLALWGADYNDPMTFLDMFVTDGMFNDTGYSNPEYDSLIQKADKETDSLKRTEYLVEAEKLLMKDMPIAPLYFRGQRYWVSDRLKGLDQPSFGVEWELKWVRVEE